jgi:glycine/D-amino acid oxidase-like deaminating enzyme/nitrite reductase/ring-hydroxylating ferredoxin subunit
MSKSNQEAPRSVWLDEELISTRPLTSDTGCDVCVVGAGIAGVLIAERLAGAGMRVVLLDAGQVGGGETARTTAHLVTALDDRYAELKRAHGEDGARLAAESHRAAIDHVEQLVRRLGIECGWMRLDGYLTVNEKHAHRRDELLREELEAATRAGLASTLVAQLPAGWPSSGPALCFPDQAQLHPVQLLNGVTRHLIGKGVQVHTETKATEIHGGPDARVETEAGPVVRCSHVVVATNSPVNNLVAVHTKQSGYQTYVIGVRVGAGSLPPLLLWDGLWEDDVSYHYLRLLEGAKNRSDLLIVGGEDHKTGQSPEHPDPWAELERWTRARFPAAGEVEYHWSGEVMEPADGMAFIGPNAVGRKNVYVVTGDSGNGMTHGAVAALLIPEQIMGREHPWSELYDPARKVGLAALKEFAEENFDTLAQYRDWFRRGDVADESAIPRGQGAVLREGLKRIAVYRNPHGAVTRLNATCTHLGCVVRWNDLESTWDCPCHGSRFDPEGKVIHGPAVSDLAPAGEAAAPVAEALEHLVHK